MIRALVTGTLHADPQARTSQNGNAFALCKVKADDKAGAWVWVSAIAFGDAAERLLQLKAGDSVSLSGRAEVGGWADKDGTPRGSLSLVADEVAALRAKPKPRAEGQRRTSRSDRQPAPAGADGGTPFDDLEDWQP